MRSRSIGLCTDDNFEILSHEILFGRTGKILNIADLEIQNAITKHCVDSGVKVLFIDNLSTAAFGLKENEADSWEKMLPWTGIRQVGDLARMFKLQEAAATMPCLDLRGGSAVFVDVFGASPVLLDWNNLAVGAALASSFHSCDCGAQPVDYFAAWDDVHIAQAHDCFRHRKQVVAVSFQPCYLLPHGGIQGLH